jgi:hypothetical protein
MGELWASIKYQTSILQTASTLEGFSFWVVFFRVYSKATEKYDDFISHRNAHQLKQLVAISSKRKNHCAVGTNIGWLR